MTQKPRPDRYLLLLQQPSLAVCHEAAARLRDVGLAVLARFGRSALEVLATPADIERVRALGLFSAALKGPMSAEHFERLDEEQRQIVGQWNVRFTRGYRQATKERAHAREKWSAQGKQQPLPYSAVDPEEFKAMVATHRKRAGLPPVEGAPRRPRAKAPGLTARLEALERDQFTRLERELAERYKDPTLAYHLARLVPRLDRLYEAIIRDLPADLLKELLDRFFRYTEAACWEMTGEMSVGVVFVESSRSGGPRFGAAERTQICQEIIDGLSWLAAEHPAGNLTWVYDFQFVRIDVADGDDDSNETYWRDPAMAQVSYGGRTYSAAWSAVADYRDDMRLANRSAHALVIFVTPYGTEWHAYAGGGRITLAKRGNWGGWGQSVLDRIAAHETCHLFGAADEYTGSGTPCSSCETTHGCDNIPNGNCGSCADPQQACVMDQNALRLCSYTRAQIGWSTIFVELWTADVSWAGTDDDVELDIGDRTFVLDNPNHDDRERGNREGYAIWADGLPRSDIRRVLIRKSPDGFAGGWKLARVRVWHQGQLVCDQSPNRWLEDDRLTWVGCIADTLLVNTLVAKVTTADVGWAGTDDDVTLRMAGRSWNLDTPVDDFERGHTDTFHLDPRTGVRVADIHSVTIGKSPDGFAGGWKLKGLEIIVNGATIYNNQGINRWLEDDSRTWTDSV